MEYRTYLFDFDGTLVDSMPTFASVVLRILDEHGIPYGDDLVKIVTPLGFAGTAKYFISLGLDKPQEEIMELMVQYMSEQYLFHIPAKSNVLSTLQELKRRGCSLNVLTASPHATLDPCLKRVGLWELFDNVWSCDDFNTTKADPNIYRMAAQRIGAPIEEVLFLDDNFNADQSAKASGIGVCGVYDPSSAEYEEDIKSIADYYIHDFSELL